MLSSLGASLKSLRFSPPLYLISILCLSRSKAHEKKKKKKAPFERQCMLCYACRFCRRRLKDLIDYQSPSEKRPNYTPELKQSETSQLLSEHQVQEVVTGWNKSIRNELCYACRGIV